MNTSKKLPRGAKQKLITSWLTTHPHWSNFRIATSVGCHATYVARIRAELEHRPLQTAELPEDLLRQAEEATENTAPEPTPGTAVVAVLDERHHKYGAFRDVAQTAVDIKVILQDALQRNGYTFDADQVEAMEMIATKLARIANGNPHLLDNWFDIAGYAQLVYDRLQGVAR